MEFSQNPGPAEQVIQKHYTDSHTGQAVTCPLCARDLYEALSLRVSNPTLLNALWKPSDTHQRGRGRPKQ